MFQAPFQYYISKSKASSVLLFTVLSLVNVSAFSAAIGLPESTARFGFGAKVSRVSVSDEQGRTNDITSTQSSSIYFTDWIFHRSRYLSELHISNYAFEADQSHIGQTVNQYGVRFSVQTNIRMTKYFAPWVGGGLDLSHTMLKKRHSVDSDGFLLQRYEDETKFGLNLLLNVMEKWTINSTMDMAAKLEYSAPITSTVGGVSASLLFLFRPIL